MAEGVGRLCAGNRRGRGWGCVSGGRGGWIGGLVVQTVEVFYWPRACLIRTRYEEVALGL